MSLNRRQFLQGMSLAGFGTFFLRFAPAASATEPVVEAAVTRLPIPITFLMDRIIGNAASLSLIQFSRIDKGVRTGLMQYQHIVLQPPKIIPPSWTILKDYHDGLKTRTEYRSTAQNLFQEIVNSFAPSQLCTSLLHEINRNHPGAQISDLAIDDEYIIRLMDRVVNQNSYLGFLNDFIFQKNVLGDLFSFTEAETLFHNQELQLIVKTLIGGTETDLKGLCAEIGMRIIGQLNEIEKLAATAMQRDLTLRNLKGDEIPIDRETMVDILKAQGKLPAFDGQISEIIPRLRRFSSRPDAYMVTGVDLIITKPDGQSTTQPLQNWLPAFEAFRKGFSEESTLLGDEEIRSTTTSLLLRIQPGSSAAHVFQEIAARQNSQICVTR